MRNMLVVLAIVCAAAWSTPAAAQVSLATQVVTAPDGQLGDAFGRRVAISGTRMIVGASGDDDRAIDAGSAYIFVRDSKGKWTQEQKLAPNSLQGNDWFGWSVDIDGDTAVVGAPNRKRDANGVYQGIAYVFRLVDSTWQEVAVLQPANLGPYDRFGWRVAVAGDHLMVSAPGHAPGAVYPFVRSAAGWTQEAELLGGAGDGFGAALDLAPSVALVGRTAGPPKLMRYVRSGGSWKLIGHEPALAPSVDGQGETAHFARLELLSAEPSGAVLVADRQYQQSPAPPFPPPVPLLLRRVGTDGMVRTLGELPADSLALEVDGDGLIWSANATTVRKRTATGTDTTVTSALSRVRGLESDGAGGMFTIDRCAVRRLHADGSLETLAGVVDDCAYVDGVKVTVRFQLPEHLVRFGDYLFVSDGTALRRLSLTTGTVDTVAGVKSTGTIQFPTDGVGSNARFAEFRAMAVDGTGIIWVSDSNRLRKVTQMPPPPGSISPTFVVTTVAGGATNIWATDGLGTAATLNAVDLDIGLGGQIVFADEAQETVNRVYTVRASNPAGDVRTIAGWAPSMVGLGYDVAVLENQAIAGSPTLSLRLPPVFQAGAAWHFKWSDAISERIPTSNTLVKDVEPLSRYGAGVSFVGNSMVALGALNGCYWSTAYSCEGGSAGAQSQGLLPVLLYRAEGGNWALHATLVPPALQANSGYGSTMASDGTFLVVGAAQADPATTPGPMPPGGYISGNGQVFVYDMHTLDADKDTMPDTWELTYGLNPNNQGDASGDLDADGVTNEQEYKAGTHPANDPALTRYFAEGATSDFFDTQFYVANPGDADANVLFRFMTSTGASILQPVSVPARAGRTLRVGDVGGLTKAEFATMVETDRAIVVDRVMRWSAADAYGSHGEHATIAPAPKWYLAEGATHSGFDLFYLLQNPNDVEVRVRVSYLRPSGAPIQKTYTVGPNSRFNVWVDQETFGADGKVLANTDVSAVLEALDGLSIIVERAMYLTSPVADPDAPGTAFEAGHASVGLTEPATTWFFAEGATGDFFDEFLLLSNPSTSPAEVKVTYLLPDGTTYSRTLAVAGESRTNIWVDLERIPGVDGFPLRDAEAVSATLEVTNGVPIVAERAMWWPGPAWTEAHNSAGATTSAARWGVGAGRVADSPSRQDTYYLIANPSLTDATVRLTALYQDGTPAEQIEVEVPAQSRFSVDMRSRFANSLGKSFGVLVESLGEPPTPIVVEWSLYGDALGKFWAAGANALATPLP